MVLNIATGFILVLCCSVAISAEIEECPLKTISSSLTLIGKVPLSSPHAGTKPGGPGSVTVQKAYYKAEAQLQLSWFDAWKFCRDNCLHLASIESEVEKNVLAKSLQNETTRIWWTSGTDLGHRGQYVWMSSGNAFNYTNWHAGEPNNSLGNQECLRLWDNDGNSTWWDDYHCHEALNFICQGEDVQKQPGLGQGNSKPNILELIGSLFGYQTPLPSK